MCDAPGDYQVQCCDRKSRAACAQSLNAAASNNRDHASQSLLLLLARASHIYFCPSHTSHSRWIIQSTQHHRWGCNNIPYFLQRTTPITRSLCEGWTRHDLHILVTAPFCCNRKSWASCAQSFPSWQQGTIELTWRDHSIIACSRTSRLWRITQSTQHHRRGCNSSNSFFAFLTSLVMISWVELYWQSFVDLSITPYKSKSLFQSYARMCWNQMLFESEPCDKNLQVIRFLE